MAHYNKIDDSINGCEKYSKIWWHEKGHQILENSKFGSNLMVIQHYYFLLLVILLVSYNFYKINIIRTFSLIFLLGMISIEIYHEIYAWYYAYKKKKKSNRKLKRLLYGFYL